MPTVTISEENYKSLIEISGKIQQIKKEKISINDIIDFFIDFYNNYENAEKIIFTVGV